MGPSIAAPFFLPAYSSAPRGPVFFTRPMCGSAMTSVATNPGKLPMWIAKVHCRHESLVCFRTDGLGCRNRATGDEKNVEIGGFVYRNVDPGPPLREKPRSISSWVGASPGPEEKTAVFVPFITDDPGAYRPYRVPSEDERLAAGSRHVGVAKGETTALWLGVQALHSLRAV
jgi:hypothetical protein